MDRNIHTFIGCESEYTDADVVMFGAPFDSTTSYRPGTRFASSAIRNESFGLETYSPYQDKDLMDYQIYDGGDLELPFGAPKEALRQIEEYVDTVLADDKIPLMIGGAHLVTLGAVRSADLVGDNKIYQFGIRSGDREEFRWGKNHVITCKFNFDTLDEVVEKLKGKPVYFTLDLDVLDPSVFPGTGTPEAGGVTFMELLEAIKKVSALNVVALDMNELSPIYDQTGASTAVACKILREMLLLFGSERV